MKYSFPVSQEKLGRVVAKFPTPFYLYDEDGVRKTIRSLRAAFAWNTSFKEYFAVKATPNPHILRLLKSEHAGADCSSLAELTLAEQVGLRGEEIMFTSNNTTQEEFMKAQSLGAIINLDDITHLEAIEKLKKQPQLLCFRYNPGPLRKGTSIMGSPQEAKYGMTKRQLFEGYARAKKGGVKRFGLHTMIISNELNSAYFIKTAAMMFTLVEEIFKKTGVQIEFVNLGGGIGIPYRPEQQPIDIKRLGEEVRKKYVQLVLKKKIKPFALFLECGRYITGPHGYLVTKAINTKDIYRNYIGVDASMADLMRPGMYGAYHHITVLGKEKKPCTQKYDVVGSLCENNDKFAIQRRLPKIEKGDILILHDVGAHGHAMGFNYNGKLRHAELLLQRSGSVTMIRRAETLKDYFATLKF